jgi:hypothetical protein
MRVLREPYLDLLSMLMSHAWMLCTCYTGVASLDDLGSNEVDRMVVDVVRVLFRSNAFWLLRQHDRLPLA